MDIGDIQFFKQRWQRVEEVTNREIRMASPAENWQQLNALRRRASLLGFKADEDETEGAVMARWAAIKNRFIGDETG